MHFTNPDFLFLLLLTILQCAVGVFGRLHKGGTHVVDATKLTTNAARMRAGLPPLKPRSMYMPTRIGARAANPSLVTSPNAITGYIQVNRANDSNLEGYVMKDHNGTGFVGLTPRNDDSRLSITFKPVNPFNIAINNPEGPYPFLGFAGDSLTGNLSNYMVHTNPTSSGSRPLPVGNNLNLKMPNSESTIWSYDPQRRRLTPQWINSDGRSISTSLWFHSPLNALAIVTNPAGQPRSGSYEVHFTVVFS